MPADPDASLQQFLESQDPSTLVTLLMELAQDHDAVRKRLARLQLAAKPAKLAAAFRKTLSAWKRSTRYLDYHESPAFARELEAWLKEIERDLPPRDPAAALELAESFIAADGSFFERSDDSDGDIGEAVAAGCRLWLQAAARCETPADEWPPRMHGLVIGDDYGARDELLREAASLLDADGLRTLAALFEQDLHAAVAARSDAQSLPSDVYSASAALAILSDALADPDLRLRAVLAHSPQPNPHQVLDVAAAYLRHGRPADALRWLEGSAWERQEDTRQRLLADALGALGRRDESAPIRQQLFEQSMAPADLRAWLEDLAAEARPAVIAHARTLAQHHGNPVAAARLLLELGEDELAENVLVDEEGAVRQCSYVTLVPLARELDGRARWRGATCVYRALLDDVLARAYAVAYPHAARYWVRLHAIAAEGADLAPLQPHAVYAEGIRKQHSRKSRFWSCVAEAGGPR